MRSLADDIHQLEGRPPNAINVYLVGDVLVDAGTPGATRRILRELEGRACRRRAGTRSATGRRCAIRMRWHALRRRCSLTYVMQT